MNKTMRTKALVLRTLIQGQNVNPYGIASGGFLMGQMDYAGAVHAVCLSGGRVFTVAADKIALINPAKAGDVLNLYATIQRLGKTSISVLIEAVSERVIEDSIETLDVAKGIFVYVAVDRLGHAKDFIIKKPSSEKE